MNNISATAAIDWRPPVDRDRAGLEALVDECLAAFVAHDPARLPLAPAVRYTENGQALALGDGLWGTASDIGAYRHYFADVEAGQAAFIGTLHENGLPLMIALRIGLALDRIAEIEVVLYRVGSGPAWNDAGFDNLERAQRPRPMWQETIPPEERLSRAQLIATANMYFEGLQGNDGKGIYPFTDDCDRLENGVYTTNNSEITIGAGGVNAAALGCREQFETGLYGVVTRIHDRRFMLVDRERGVVFTFVVFDHGGTVKSATLPDGRVVPIPYMQRPSSILLGEAFKIERNLIRQVEAVGSSVPYHMRTGWPV